jgi:hypothetical protein
MAITGAEIRNVIESGQTLSISVNRLYGTTYCIGAQYSDEKHAGPVIAPGSDESLKFGNYSAPCFIINAGHVP